MFRFLDLERFVKVCKKKEKICFLLLLFFCAISFSTLYRAYVPDINVPIPKKSDSQISARTIGLLRVSTPRENVIKLTRKMAVFWVGEDLKNFLFKGLSVNSDEGFASICLALTSTAILLEGLRKLRDHCYTKFVEERKLNHVLRRRSRSATRIRPRGRTSRASPNSRGLEHDYGAAGDIGDASMSLMTSPLNDSDESDPRGSQRKSVFRIPQFEKENCRVLSILTLSTMLHMVYITIGYILMLAVMTFNVWVFVAIAIGIGIGRFFFGTDDIHEIIIIEDKVMGMPAQNFGTGDGCINPSPSDTAVTSLGSQDLGSCDSKRSSSIPAQSRNAGPESRENPYASNSSGSGNYREQLTTEILVHPTTSSS